MNKLIPFAMSFVILMLFAGVLFETSAAGDFGQVRELTEWTMETGGASAAVSLPVTLDDPEERASVVLTARVSVQAGEYLYLKTVYTPVEVYADGVQIFAYGQEGTYPAFLLDPPTMVRLVPLPQTGSSVTLKLRYLAPSQRSSMTLYPIMQGETGELLTCLFSRMGFSLFFSIILMALGILLWLTAVLLIRFEKVGVSILWLGLFSFLVGMWIFGECNLTGIFIQNPSLLYLMAFTGLFTMADPLIRCGGVIINPHHPGFFRCICTIMELAVTGAVLLQFLGIAAFSRTMYL